MEQKIHQRFIIISGLLNTTLMCLLLLLNLKPGNNIESILYDYRFVIKNRLLHQLPPQDILIVEIDEKSLDAYGRWPWSRRLQGKLIKKVLQGNPRVLAIDIVYPEPESPQADTFLGNILKKSKGKIVLATGFDRAERGDSELLLPPRLSPDFVEDSAISRIKEQSRTATITTVNILKIGPEAIYRGSVLGHVYSPPETDGKIRWEYLYVRFSDELYPSLGLATAIIGLGRSIEDLTIYGDRGAGIGEIFIPSDTAGRMRINYIGKERTFHYISAYDVLKKPFNPDIFKDRIVLIGTTAISTYDFAVTPLSARMPGVEKNATVIENIINKRFIKDLPLTVTMLVIFLSGIFLTLLLSRLRARSGMVASFSVLSLFLFLNLYLFMNNLYMNLLYPMLNLIMISFTGFSYKYIKEERRARELKRIFSSYVSPKIVEQLINNPDMARLGGQRREITVLFSDIMGFTSLSEKHEPEEVVALLNEYFKAMTDIIFKWDGTLDKFVGDEIMAFWNAPVEQPNHAELAIRCSLDMSDRLDKLQKKWQSEGKPVLDCGIGINTGTVLIGNIGAEGKKMDYTAIGDHVNLGARIEKLTRECNTRILITEFTYKRITPLVKDNLLGHIEITEVGTVQVKGKEKPVKIYSIRTLPHPS
jgi:adenylate cyclase